MKFPIFYENSKIPVWISKIAPIKIRAISFGLWVFDRGVTDDRIKRHETIHYLQQKELFFIGQWVLYAFFWLWGFIKYKNGKEAYYRCPFEQEAYYYQLQEDYLETRKPYAWRKFVV